MQNTSDIKPSAGDDDSDLLGCYAKQQGYSSPRFRRNVPSSSSRVEKSYRKSYKNSSRTLQPLKMRAAPFFETLELNNIATQQNNPKT
jgi:hypothetical protein